MTAGKEKKGRGREEEEPGVQSWETAS